MPLSLVEPRLNLQRICKSSEICMLTNIQKGCVSDSNLGGGKEGKERLLRNNQFSIGWFWGFFYLFIGFGGLCFVLPEGLGKGSHCVLITRYLLETLT